MKIDDNSQLFLLLVWLITLVAFLCCLWLLRDVRNLRNEVKQEAKQEAPYAIPRKFAQAKQPAKLLVPPPPPDWQPTPQ